MGGGGLASSGILTWEDAYCDNAKPAEDLGSASDDSHVNRSKPISFQSRETSMQDIGSEGCQIELLVANMSCVQYALGDGLVGDVACTGKHTWVFFNNFFTREFDSNLVPDAVLLERNRFERCEEECGVIWDRLIAAQVVIVKGIGNDHINNTSTSISTGGGSSEFQSSLNYYIWPMPKDALLSHGHNNNNNNNNVVAVVIVAKDFHLSTKYGDVSGILSDAFSRLVSLIQLDHIANLPTSSSSLIHLQGLNVVVSSKDEELRYGIDESYNLSIPSPHPGKPLYAYLEAKTVYGALHGFQDMIICILNSIFINIDTSRHYLPLPVIKNVIESMTYAKLNVLHWHIVDSQSFPLEIPSFPKLWNGAYSDSERYTVADAKEIVRRVKSVFYAQRRGINVLAEIDVPGHALSWGIGYPSLWPSKTCQEPLDVSSEFTFKVISGILSGCWTTTPRIRKWLRKQGMNGSEAYEYFVLRAQNIALSYGYDIVNWEETFNNFGNRLSRKTVVHNWLGDGVAQKAVAAGLRCIVSNQDKWYLDHLDAEWQGFYSNEPLANITNPKQQRLVIGGEVCMWGEHIDASDIQQTIWPRAAAAAERLWTPYDKLAKDPRDVTGRLAHFRCLLTQRGIAAAPLAGPGRVAPEEPGSCYKQ
ncbi:Beta-hexosaminidase subunit [Morus notabilis]|uniref:beta-N-acetylhexosaminidase n=1 Tax=Morus notabilis TaxID=981085 RepID=W9S4D5_9ROSA|nr:Beta-hexosaminidase subunit [Morus notabilis]